MLASPGIGSGLDINSLVAQLVSAEGAPVQFRLDQEEAAVQAKISAYDPSRVRYPTFKLH